MKGERSAQVVDWIVKSNIFVFFLWYLFLFINPTFMENNFLVSWSGLMEGRIWTLLTAVFSHNLLFHIFVNMYFFYGFGKAMEETLGSREFLKLYLISGLSGSLSHCLVSAFFLDQPGLPALGASGAISGVIVLFALMYPSQKVYLLGLLPLPAFWAVLMFVGFDVWGLMEQTHGSQAPIGHGAHLGGALSGLLYFFRNSNTRRFRKTQAF